LGDWRRILREEEKGKWKEGSKGEEEGRISIFIEYKIYNIY
jgi:hypothetical protein